MEGVGEESLSRDDGGGDVGVLHLDKYRWLVRGASSV